MFDVIYECSPIILGVTITTFPSILDNISDKSVGFFFEGDFDCFALNKGAKLDVVLLFVLPEYPESGADFEVLNTGSSNSDWLYLIWLHKVGFPIEIKAKIRHHIICCYHNFMRQNYDNN